MTFEKSPILNDVVSLMLWYAPKRFNAQPDNFPKSFPCIAFLAQSGDHPSIRPGFGSSDEGLSYAYPDDFSSLKTSPRKKRKTVVKRSHKRSRGEVGS